MLVFFRPRHPKKMFYQRLTLPIHELENKRQLKCTFMSIDQKEEKEVTLYPNKGSRVEQMLEEAKQVGNCFSIFTIDRATNCYIGWDGNDKSCLISISNYST